LYSIRGNYLLFKDNFGNPLKRGAELSSVYFYERVQFQKFYFLSYQFVSVFMKYFNDVFFIFRMWYLLLKYCFLNLGWTETYSWVHDFQLFYASHRSCHQFSCKNILHVSWNGIKKFGFIMNVNSSKTDISVKKKVFFIDSRD